MEDVAVVGAGVVQEVVCLLALLPAFNLVEGVVAHMLDLDGAVDCSSIALRKASFFGSALFADNFVFEVIRDALLSLQAEKALSRITTLVFEQMKELSIVKVASIHRSFVEIVIVHDE